ncbi:MAG: NAD-dependent epimerase/dehydratase family protein, partial [Cyanobacteria bacterium P01_H01_bin.58]
VEGKPLQIYNYGQMQRDFTYIDDIVNGILRVVGYLPQGKTTSETSSAPYQIYNIGNNRPVSLLRFIETLELALGIEANKTFLPMQPGDVPATYADISAIAQDVGFQPHTPIEIGIPKFVDWYLNFYTPKTTQHNSQQSLQPVEELLYTC